MDPFANDVVSPTGLVINGDYLYAVNNNQNQIAKILLSDGSLDTSFTASLNESYGIATDGTNLYAASYDGGSIVQISLEEGTTLTWVDSIANPTGLVIYNGSMYVASSDISGSIYKINLDNRAVSSFIEGLTYANGLAIQGGNLYVARYNGIISKVDLTNGQIIDANWATLEEGLYGITTYGSNIYVSNSLTGTITKLYVNSAGSFATATGFGNPYGVLTDGINMYIANNSSNCIYKIDISGNTFINPCDQKEDNTTIKDGVLQIANGPYNCSYYNVPSTVTNVPENVFANWPNLGSIYFPSTVVGISTTVFLNCPISTLVFEQNSAYADSDGFAGLVAPINGTLQSVVVPKLITNLNDGIFVPQSKNSFLSNVSFQQGSLLSNIGNYAFDGCPISNFDFSGLTKLSYIGNSAFLNAGISNVVFPSSFIGNGDNVFQGSPVTSISFLPNSAYSDSNGFWSLVSPSMGSLQSVTIPRLVTKLNDRLFLRFNLLNNVTVQSDSDLSIIGVDAFSGCPITNFDFGNLTKLSYIDNTAFAYTFIPSVVFPSSFIGNGTGVFLGTQVASISFSPNSAYSNADSFLTLVAQLGGSLQSMTIPKSLPALNANTFSGYSNLSNVTIQSGSFLSTIAYAAFSGCSSLPAFDFSNLTKLSYIGDTAFNNTGISNVVFPSSFIGNGSNVFIQSPVTSISFLPNSAYSDSGSFSTLVAQLGGSLQSVTIPKSLTTLNANTFNKFYYLSTVTLQSGSFLSTIGFKALYGCPITNFDFSSLTKLSYIDDSAFAYTGLSNVVFPSSFVGNGPIVFLETPVTSISFLPNSAYSDADSFSNLVAPLSQSLQSVTIPKSLTSLNPNTFNKYHSLSNVEFQNGCRLSNIGGWAFEECPISNVNFSSLPNLSYIGDYAFKNTLISNVVFPSSFMTNGTRLFQGSPISSISFAPNSAYAYTDGFANLFGGIDSNLQSVTIPELLTVLPDATFSNFSLLSNVTIQQGSLMNTIGMNAFQNCPLSNFAFDSLTNLTSIGDYAFAGTKIQAVSLPNSLTAFGSNTFGSTPLSSITVQSSFAISNLTQANIGLKASQVTVYTFGVPIGDISLFEFSTINLYTNPPLDNPDTFKQIVQNSSVPIVLTNVNVSSLTAYDPTSTLLTATTLNAIGCTPGTEVPLSYLNPSPSVVNYLTVNIGETVYINSKQLTLIDTSNVSYDGVSKLLAATFDIAGQTYNFFASGSLFFSGVTMTAGSNLILASDISNWLATYTYRIKQTGNVYVIKKSLFKSIVDALITGGTGNVVPSGLTAKNLGKTIYIGTQNASDLVVLIQVQLPGLVSDNGGTLDPLDTGYIVREYNIT